MSHAQTAPDSVLGEVFDAALGAADAGATVLASMRGQAEVTAAADTKSAAGDWVTQADRASEQAIREYIHARRPDDALTGEEYDATGDTHAEYRWCIDPLDGTANFVRGLPHYAVSVAVARREYLSEYLDEDGNPTEDTPFVEHWVAGVVIAPELKQMWAATASADPAPAEAGHAYTTAWDAERAPSRYGEEPSRTLTAEASAGASSQARILAYGFGYGAGQRQNQAQALTRLIPHFDNVRRLGSAAIDMCLVADGTLDAYAETNINEWDWAAGAFIAETAGFPVQRPLWNGSHSYGWCLVGDVHGQWLGPIATINTGNAVSVSDAATVDTASGDGEVNAGAITLRYATYHDDEAIRELTERAYLHAGYFESADHRYMQRVAQVAERRRHALMFVAEDADQNIVASVTFSLAGSLWADLAEDGELEMRLFVVDPRFQRTGLGGKLVEKFLEFAETLPGIHSLVLTTTPDWEPAMRFYARYGFSRDTHRDVDIPEVPGLWLAAFSKEISQHHTSGS